MPLEENIFNSNKKNTGEMALSNSVIGFRVFKTGDFNKKSFKQFIQQIKMIKMFKEYLNNKLNKEFPKISIITNDNLPEIGKQLIVEEKLEIIYVKHILAERRAKLGGKTCEKSNYKVEFSYADMLNSLGKSINFKSKKYFIFCSSDLTSKPEVLLSQLIGMANVYNKWQKEKHVELSMVGSLVEGVHNHSLIKKIINEKKNINLQNLNELFPNNVLSMVPSNTKFSTSTDNFFLGEIKINGKKEPIGGNEDFMYGFNEMLINNRKCILLIDPFISSQRQNEIKGVGSKYLRRKIVYNLYAERLIKQAINQKKINLNQKDFSNLSELTLESVVENIIDKNLFFVKINTKNQPEIILTKRQKEKSINILV